MDVAQAIRSQNLDAAAGQIGQPPAPPGQSYQLPIDTLGRLIDPEQFGDIIVKVEQATAPSLAPCAARTGPEHATAGRSRQSPSGPPSRAVATSGQPRSISASDRRHGRPRPRGSPARSRAPTIRPRPGSEPSADPRTTSTATVTAAIIPSGPTSAFPGGGTTGGGGSTTGGGGTAGGGGTTAGGATDYRAPTRPAGRRRHPTRRSRTAAPASAVRWDAGRPRARRQARGRQADRLASSACATWPGSSWRPRTTTMSCTFDGQPVGRVWRSTSSPGTNALDVADRVQAEDGAAQDPLPRGRRLRHPLRHDAVHPRVGRRGGAGPCSRPSCWWRSWCSCSCRTGGPS